MHVPKLCENNLGGTYCMLNLRKKNIKVSQIYMNKTYGEQVSREENTKANTYILQY